MKRVIQGAGGRVKRGVHEVTYWVALRLSPRLDATAAPRTAREYERLRDEFGVAPGQRLTIEKQGHKYRIVVTKVAPGRVEYELTDFDRANWMPPARLKAMQTD